MTGFSLTNPDGNKADLTLQQGKTISLPLIWGGSTPIDVTGYDASLCAKEAFLSPTNITEFTVANSRVSIGSTDGLITFSMTAEDSAALPAPKSGVYEIEVVSDTGVVYSTLRGKLTILPEVCA